MTTYINASQELSMVTWGVDDAGKLTMKDNRTEDVVNDQALTATTSVMSLADNPNTNSNGLVKIIKWVVSNNGFITARVKYSPPQPIRVANVAAAGNLVGAFVQYVPPQTLRVVNWVVLNPQ